MSNQQTPPTDQRLLTFRYRVKDSSSKRELKRMSLLVNQIWNFANETSIESARRKNPWVSEYTLNRLTTDISKKIGLPSRVIRAVNRQYCHSRQKSQKPKLNWRSCKRSLGWIPFAQEAVQATDKGFRFNGREYKCWMSRPLGGEIKTGSFSQDASGRWYINLVCEVPIKNTISVSNIGVDLGLKELATCSDGKHIENPRHIRSLENKLATAQRANHKKQVRNIHRKIANKRKDHLHKESSKLVNQHKKIFIGNVSSSRLKKTRMAKSVSDAGWSIFKRMLVYKAIGLGVEVKIVNESYSSVTCSSCFQRTGPSGLGALGVRFWECPCGVSHDRDVNAAQNILRVGLGLETPLGELA